MRKLSFIHFFIPHFISSFIHSYNSLVPDQFADETEGALQRVHGLEGNHDN